MSLHNTPATPVSPWPRLALWLGTLALVGLTQVGCAVYPYPPAGVYVHDHGYRHMPAPAWGYRGHGERFRRW